MIACLDVHYVDSTAYASGVVLQDWPDEKPVEERVVRVPDVQPYIPGQFFLRELPCLLAVLKVLPEAQVVVVDGYVWLNQAHGLGAHLYDALDGKVAVIGVAKTKFHQSSGLEIKRGESKNPLIVTAAGMSPESAAKHILSMHGRHRIPTLLARVDRLSRNHLSV